MAMPGAVGYRCAARAGPSPSPLAETQVQVTTMVRAMSGSVRYEPGAVVDTGLVNGLMSAVSPRLE